MCRATLVVYLNIHQSIQSFFSTVNTTTIFPCWSADCADKFQTDASSSRVSFYTLSQKKSRKSTTNFIPVRLSACPHGTERLAMDRFSWNFKFGNLAKIWRHSDLDYSRTKIRHFVVTLNASLSSPNMNDFRNWQRLCSLWGTTWGWRLSSTQHPGPSMICIS